MNIALDYDGTYTADPKLWDFFLEACKRRGHNVFCVTMRYPHEIVEIDCPVIYTSRKAKIKFVDDLGTQISIWIDDNPFWLFGDACE